jgi:DNA polymerase-3 subunit alpha
LIAFSALPTTFDYEKQTFALLQRGETKGIFQLESGGIRDLLQRMKPDHFRDIIATNALYRPGPLEGGMVDDYVQVKHGRKQAEYMHPDMKEVLEETHGVMVYQEQVMRILNRLGGIELPDAYSCIKAISKKKLETIAKFREKFVAGGVERGLSQRQAIELFELIEKFAGYGFNKSHSTAYALIAYMTAYLKAHYSVEFMAALLCGDMAGRNFKKKDSLVEHLEDCRRMHIEVVPPDVNASHGDFTVANGKIHFGLAAIKGCGDAAAAAIVKARKNGPFRDLFDFCERLDPAVVNRSSVESLIKAGAFDSTGAKRAQLAAVLERAMQTGAAAVADRRSGQKGLFAEAEEAAPAAPGAGLPNIPELDSKDKLLQEKEVLGFYLTSHPLAEQASKLATFCTHSTQDAPNLPHRTEVMMGGMMSAIKFAHTKNPRAVATKYAMFDLEDMEGSIRCILWPEQFATQGHHVQPDTILAVRGAIDRRPGSEESNLIVNELIPISELATRYTKGAVIHVREEAQAPRALENLHEILRGYPGTCELKLVLWLADGSKVHLQSDSLRIDVNAEMRRRVDELLGAGNLQLVAAPPQASAPPPRSNGAGRAMARR